MRKLLGTCLFLFLFTGSGVVLPAYAQDGGSSIARQVENLSAEGAQAFRAGDYETAIARFEEAYALQPVPNLLYNIGRAYEQMEMWDEAIAHFERFITAPDVESEAREHAMQRVQSLREIKALASRDSTPQESDEKAVPEDPVAPPPQVEGPNRLPGFLVAGSGVALVGGGVVMGLMAKSNADQLTDTSLDYDQRLAARNAARTQGIVADVLYASGAIAAGVGVYLIVTAGGKDEPAPLARSIFPWVGKESAGLGMTLNF